MLDLSFHDLVTTLSARLTQPLPGIDAQRIMAPLPRAGWRPDDVPPDARRAAGLVLLYPFDDRPHMALTLRASHLPTHGGQVSLPGGAIEPDETIEMTAVREAVEEVGVAAASIRLVGLLSPLHIPVSNFVLHPVIGVTDTRPSFLPAAHEVARVIDVALSTLGNPASVGLRYHTYEGLRYEVPYFAIGDDVIWGATAMVLAEFLAVLGSPPVRPVSAEPRGSSFSLHST